MRTYTGDELLEAPGILRNPVPARALFDRTAAHEATLRNLLQRHGYASLAEIHQEGRQEGERLLLMRLMERKFGPLSEELRVRLNNADAETLLAWSERLLIATSVDAIFEGSILTPTPER